MRDGKLTHVRIVGVPSGARVLRLAEAPGAETFGLGGRDLRSAVSRRLVSINTITESGCRQSRRTNCAGSAAGQMARSRPTQ